MRIIVAGPPKSGNVWLDHLLANVYDLKIRRSVPPYDFWGRQDIDADGYFPGEDDPSERSIFHQHFWPLDGLFRFAERFGHRLVTPIRNPYDVFVSLYFYAQNFRGVFLRGDGNEKHIVSRPIDHPDVLSFLEGDFGAYIDHGVAWIASGRSVIARYEDLHADPRRALRDVTDQLAPVDDTRIEMAIEASHPDRLRANDPGLRKHIRTATVGDWRKHLTAAHLEIFRTTHGDRIRALGYAVIEPAEASPLRVVDRWPESVLEELRQAHVEIARHEAEIEQLHREVAERHKAITWLHEEVAERHKTITWLHQEVAKRDESIRWLHREVADRDETIQLLYSGIAERDQTIARLQQDASRIQAAEEDQGRADAAAAR